MIILFFVFLSFALSFMVVFYTLTPAVIVLCAVASFFGAWFFRGVQIFFPLNDGISSPLVRKYHIILPAFFLFLSVSSIFFLFQVSSNTTRLSPWQVIHPYFLPVFFLLTLVLGFLIMSGHRVRTILFFIIIHAFVQHLYLPLSHELPWGGDVWRHIAVEEKLADGEIQPPGFPEAFFIPHKYTYGQLWGVSAALSMVTRLPLTEINRWLMPILWSIVLPLFLFHLGILLFSSRRWALAFAVFPALSFPFQALGALTLPVSLGFFMFLFALILWFRYLQTGEKQIKALALMLAGLMVFGYALYFVLIWFVIWITWIIKKTKLFSLIFLMSLLIFPVIDLVVGGSRIPAAWHALSAAKQFIGQFSGWYYASAIRPHDILSGNIFFNHTPSYAFVENFFTAWRWWVIPAMLALWGVAVIGFFKAPKDRIWRVLQCLSIVVFGGYVIGWYVLEGDRLFTRRLDLTLALLAIVFFLQGFKYLAQRYHVSAFIYQSIAVIAFAFFATATYASGPDLRVVSRDEYAAAQSAWASERTHSAPYCVLADTWVLLPLEAISRGKIVGGGFPIDYQFGQKERVRFFEAYHRAGVEEEILEDAKHLTGAAKCIVIDLNE